MPKPSLMAVLLGGNMPAMGGSMPDSFGFGPTAGAGKSGAADTTQTPGEIWGSILTSNAGVNPQQAEDLRKRCMMGDQMACYQLSQYEQGLGQQQNMSMQRRQMTGPALGGGGFGAGMLPMGTTTRRRGGY